MINFDFQKNCYSCSACANVCQRDAISFNEFLLPNVDMNLCVNCGRCEQVCVKMNERPFHPALSENAEGFVCKNSNEDERIASSSGGIFVLLANNILSQGGYVCGCVYDEIFMPKHILSNTIDDVKRMMGSKYVKSDLGSCFREMEIVLKQNIPVLFTGVPCQVAAAKNVLGKYSNLVLVNIVCHGAIERDFWKSYLALEKKCGTITYVTMRDKSRGWENYGLKVRYENGEEHVTYRNDDGYFLHCFTSGLFERDRCLDCQYKGDAIYGDLIIGDGWGMEKVFPDICDEYGVSSVIVLSRKGSAVLTEVQDKLISKPIDVSQIISRNGRIVSPAPERAFRKQFQRKCRDNPDKINEYCRNFANPSFIKRVVNKVYSTMKS